MARVPALGFRPDSGAGSAVLGKRADYFCLVREMIEAISVSAAMKRPLRLRACSTIGAGPRGSATLRRLEEFRIFRLGRKKEDRYKVTDEVLRQVHRMAKDGESKASIARVLDLSRPIVYAALAMPRPDA